MRIALLLVFFTLHLPAYSSFVEFAGEITNANSDGYRLYKVINDLTGEEAKFSGSVRDNGTFSMAIEINNPGLVRFEYGENEFEIFVRSIDKKIELSFDANHVNHSLLFKGQRQADNNFLKVYRKTYGDQGNHEVYSKGFLSTTFSKDISQRAKSYDIQDYFDYIKREKKYKEEYLNRTPGLSPELRSFLRKEIQWNHELNKFAFFIFNQDRIEAVKLKDYWIEYRLLQSVDINDNYSLRYTAFQNLLSCFIHYLNLENPVEVNSGKDLHYYRFIERNLSSRCRSFMQAKLMLNAFRMGEPQMAQRKFKEYKRYNTIPEYSKILEDYFGKNMQFVQKEVVPDFKFLMQNNAQKHLTDFRGKVVYVSLWASWCKPCLENFEKTRTMRSSLANQGVVLLNVNLDKTENVWRNTLARLSLPGENVFGLDLAELQTKMGFDTLPFYMLVDKLGRQSFLSSPDLNQAQSDFTQLMMQ